MNYGYSEMQKPVTSETLLCGRVKNLRRTRTTRDFMRSEADRMATGAGAVALGLSGMTALATGIAISAGSSTEEVDKVSFDIGDTRVEGWLWRCPLREGDEVEVVAESSANGATCFAVRRVEDGLIAVYPHCTIGKRAYVRKSARICTSIVAIWTAVWAYLFFVKATGITLPQAFVLVGFAAGILAAILLFFALSAYRKDRSFIAIAERVFATFGWPAPEDIDLKRTSKGKKREGDGGEYGLWVFRR